jgi:hypothetical protein
LRKCQFRNCFSDFGGNEIENFSKSCHLIWHPSSRISCGFCLLHICILHCQIFAGQVQRRFTTCSPTSSKLSRIFRGAWKAKSWWRSSYWTSC